MSKEDIKILALIIMWNSVNLLSFTTLAIIFKEWWIVLFSLLLYKGFSYGPKEKDKGGSEE